MKALRMVRAVLAAGLLALGLVPLTAGEASATSHQVVMKGYAFGPRTLTISAGDTVTWVNQDTAPHDVKTTSGPAAIHSPMLNKGDTWSFTFTAAGSYGYLCTVHPGMTGNLVVKPAAPATTAAPTHAHDGGGPSTSPPTARTSAAATASASASAKSPSTTPASGTPAPEASTSAAAAPSAPPGTAPPPQAAPVSGAGRPLDSLLVLAGVVAGVSVLCLLLVGSRTAAARAADTGGPSAGS